MLIYRHWLIYTGIEIVSIGFEHRLIFDLYELLDLQRDRVNYVGLYFELFRF